MENVPEKMTPVLLQFQKKKSQQSLKGAQICQIKILNP